MGRLWDRLVAGFRRSIKSDVASPRRSPWILVDYLPPDSGLQCQFCGRGEGDTSGLGGRQGEGQFALVQARHNPRLRHIVCGHCLKWNRISST
jgi:hypothetical protein